MKFVKNVMKILSAGLFFSIISLQGAYAQTAPAAAGETDMHMYTIILMVVILIILHAIFVPLLYPEKTPEEIAQLETKEKEKSIVTILADKISGLKPMEEEQNLLMSDDYDGIRELDNNVPPWFNILFYGTIIIAIGYLLNYHVFKTGKLPFQEYSDEVYAAEIKRDELIRTGAFINEESVELVKDPESLAMGKQIFVANCVPCHGNNAEGTVGPNLTDEFWIHGGGIKNVFKTVKYGVPVKGMIAWQNVLNPKSIQQVSSYLISLKGTAPANGKVPEGEKYVNQDGSTDSTSVKGDSLKTSGTTTNMKPDSIKFSNNKKDTTKADSLSK
ncbi:MAG: cbb3-type cytochrome c oxidase N-terminal domain-containing protein [Ignavibacteria bacterium]